MYYGTYTSTCDNCDRRTAVRYYGPEFPIAEPVIGFCIPCIFSEPSLREMKEEIEPSITLNDYCMED